MEFKLKLIHNKKSGQLVTNIPRDVFHIDKGKYPRFLRVKGKVELID